MAAKTLLQGGAKRLSLPKYFSSETFNLKYILQHATKACWKEGEDVWAFESHWKKTPALITRHYSVAYLSSLRVSGLKLSYRRKEALPERTISSGKRLAESFR